MRFLYSVSYLDNIVNKFNKPDISDDEIIDLVRELAYSGKVIKFSNLVFDFASTGGLSSLTTLLVRLYLYGFGVGVVNLAVPGRPAGAVDVLAQIKGYNLDLTPYGENPGYPFYIHLVANEAFAPLDNILFEYRKRIGKINVPNLAIASLLAKKVASGASNIGLDVRVSSFGNLGKDWNECLDNAKKFNRIANALGLQSTCFLSDANNPYQRYIGRGESLEALYDIFTSTEDPQLLEHKDYCKNIACCLIEKAGLTTSLKDINLQKLFEENLTLQGSNYAAFLHTVEKVKSQPHFKMYAREDGYIKYNLQEIRSYIVSHQEDRKGEEKYPDPCGVTLLCNTGDYVVHDTPVLSIRNDLKENGKITHRLFSIQEQPTYVHMKKEVI